VHADDVMAVHNRNVIMLVLSAIVSPPSEEALNHVIKDLPYNRQFSLYCLPNFNQEFLYVASEIAGSKKYYYY
jgi:hypothetical protein